MADCCPLEEPTAKNDIRKQLKKLFFCILRPTECETNQKLLVNNQTSSLVSESAFYQTGNTIQRVCILIKQTRLSQCNGVNRVSVMVTQNCIHCITLNNKLVIAVCVTSLQITALSPERERDSQPHEEELSAGDSQE